MKEVGWRMFVGILCLFLALSLFISLWGVAWAASAKYPNRPIKEEGLVK